MTVSPRHEHSVSRVKQLLIDKGHRILENDWTRGDGGWKLPSIACPDGKLREFTIDCMARLKSGAMVAFEIDYHYKGSAKAQSKMDHRDEMLAQFGITTIRANPADVDVWMKDPLVLQAEIDFRLEKS